MFILRRILFVLAVCTFLFGCLEKSTEDSDQASDTPALNNLVPGCDSNGDSDIHNPHCLPSPQPGPTPSPSPAPTAVWTRQFSQANSYSSQNEIYDSAMDSQENIVAVGYSFNIFDGGGSNDAGQGDAVVIKFSKDGQKLWSRQFGATGTSVNSALDAAYAVAVDSSDNIYVAGFSNGAIDLGSTRTAFFLRKYDSSGNLLWSKSTGQNAYPNAMTLDASGNIYVVGQANGAFGLAGDPKYWDGFLVKADSQGNLLWAQKFGSPNEPDSLYGVAVDGSNNIIVGGCLGLLGNCSPAIAKYDSSGNAIVQQGMQVSGTFYAITLAANGDIFVGGDVITNSLLPTPMTVSGASDAMVARYDSSGNLIWTKYYGGSSGDGFFKIRLDSHGNPISCGHTTNNMVVVKHSHDDGTLINDVEFSAGGTTACLGLQVNSSNDIYLSGYAYASLDSQSWGDVVTGFILKIGEILP